MLTTFFLIGCFALGYSFNRIVVTFRKLVETLRFLHGIEGERLQGRTSLVDDVPEELEEEALTYPKRHRRPNRRRKAQRLRAARQAGVEPKPWHRHLLDEEES